MLPLSQFHANVVNFFMRLIDSPLDYKSVN